MGHRGYRLDQRFLGMGTMSIFHDILIGLPISLAPGTNIGSTNYYTSGQDSTAGSRSYSTVWAGGTGVSCVFSAWGP